MTMWFLSLTQLMSYIAFIDFFMVYHVRSLGRMFPWSYEWSFFIMCTWIQFTIFFCWGLLYPCSSGKSVYGFLSCAHTQLFCEHNTVFMILEVFHTFLFKKIYLSTYCYVMAWRTFERQMANLGSLFPPPAIVVLEIRLRLWEPVAPPPCILWNSLGNTVSTSLKVSRESIQP